MAPRPDRTRVFLKNPIWGDIAVYCRSEPRLISEICRHLGRATGSMSQPETMASQTPKILLKTQRGKRTMYRLNESAWGAALNEALRRAEPRELNLFGERDLLIVSAADVEAACRAMLDRELPIEWGAEVLDNQIGLVLAPAGDGANTAYVRSALAQASATPTRLRIGEVMGPVALQDWGTRALGRAAKPALPPTGSG